MNGHTVYPARAGAFPAVSFPDLKEALGYAQALASDAPCGICVCPVASYEHHLPDTEG